MSVLKNAKHERFAQALAKGEAASAAYVQAGYIPHDSNASRLSGNDKVQARVAELMGNAATRAEISAARVLDELAKIAFSDLADVADWGVKEIAFGFDGDGKPVRPEDIGEAAMVRFVEAPFLRLKDRIDLSPAARASVSEVALTKDGFKIKLHDKTAALTQLGRHLKLFTDQLQHSGGVVIVAGDHDADL